MKLYIAQSSSPLIQSVQTQVDWAKEVGTGAFGLIAIAALISLIIFRR